LCLKIVMHPKWIELFYLFDILIIADIML
jgi:hypothetical protein